MILGILDSPFPQGGHCDRGKPQSVEREEAQEGDVATGLEVIQEIKAKLPDLEVILLTGHGSDEDAQKGLELGAFEYIIKPFNLSALIDVLHRAAGRDVL